MSDTSSNGARKRKHNEIKPKMQSTLDNFTFARVTEDAHQHETEFATPTSPTSLFNFEKSKSINNLLDSNVSQPKKMVIKGFKGRFPSLMALTRETVKPKVPETFEQDTWAKLERAVNAIHTQTPLPNSLEDLYQSCTNMCLHKMADGLYKRLYETIEKHMQSIFQQLVYVPSPSQKERH
jgi:hypothetical protein